MDSVYGICVFDKPNYHLPGYSGYNIQELRSKDTGRFHRRKRTAGGILPASRIRDTGAKERYNSAGISASRERNEQKEDGTGKKKAGGTLGNAAVREVDIERMERENGMLVLQGGQQGRGWSVTIGEDTGKMTLTASGDRYGFIVFGACTNP